MADLFRLNNLFTKKCVLVSISAGEAGVLRRKEGRT
jgi:hypothetical protein